MGKVRYNKKAKQYERDILINNISATIYFPEKKYLEEMSYRLYSKTRRQNTTNKGE